jgi:uncharacterized protein YneF (UPF0154 family)
MQPAPEVIDMPMWISLILQLVCLLAPLFGSAALTDFYMDRRLAQGVPRKKANLEGIAFAVASFAVFMTIGAWITMRLPGGYLPNIPPI